MSRKTGFIKLQVILLIDLIVVASAAAGYFYIASLPVPALSSDQVQLMNLQVTPPTTLVGEPVTASFNVTNIGGETGTYLAKLTLDGVQYQAQTVKLSAGETKTVEFVVTGSSGGLHVVGIGSLQESFSLTDKVAVSNLAANVTLAQVGEPIGITAEVTNNAQDTESYSFTLSVNDSAVQTKTGQLNAGQSGNILFEVSEQTPGTYIFNVSTLTGTFNVTSYSAPPTPAEFLVANLTATPGVAQPGDSITVSAVLTNVGEDTGTYSAEFTVNGQSQGTKSIQLSGGEITTVTFTVTETSTGTYNVAIGNATGSFIIQPPGNIELSNFAYTPDELWGGQTVTVSATATNEGGAPSILQINAELDGVEVQTQTVTLAPGTFVPVSYSITAPALQGGDSMSHTVGLNSMQGTFTVVETGYHTLSVVVSPSGNADFTITYPDGSVVSAQTPYSALLPVGNYVVTMPAADPTGTSTFLNWDDHSTNTARTIDLNQATSITAFYSTGSSCPSLFAWNGTSNVFVSDVSNHGWLGYINYINHDGTITYYRDNPWDYIPLDSTQMVETNGCYNLTLLQRYNEIFYADEAYMLVVDHPANTSVYSTMEEQYLDPNYMGNIYTIGDPQPPVAAYDNGTNILPIISKMDGVWTNGTNGIDSPAWNNITWNTITLNLGNLTGAKQIKLVVTAQVNWGSPDDYTTWLNEFFAAQEQGLVPNGTQVTPPPFMQVQDVNGNWVNVPQGREFPIPPETPRTFIVDLTGLFPTNNYWLRISNFWNVTFDYIGVDTTPQQNVDIQKIYPEAYLYQAFTPGTDAATGDFTKYGDVTPLLQNEDDMFVIGREGDAISMQFPIGNLTAPAPGMVRSYFLYEATWFKDISGNWGFGFGFTVNPLPFQTMSGFPYPPTEWYPNDTAHLNYLSEWNTRVIAPPPSTQNTVSVQNSFEITAFPAAAIAAVMIYINYRFGAFNIFHKRKREIKPEFAA